MTERNVLWIASYPKSGNTWVHSVLRLAGKEHGFPQVDLDAYNITRVGTTPAVCPAVSARFATPPCVVVKTHAAFAPDRELHRFTGTRLHNAAFIHIYRNPLDVLLSYVNFSRLECQARRAEPGYGRALYVEMLGYDAELDPGDWERTTLDAIPRHHLDHALDFFSERELDIPLLTRTSGSWLANTRSWLGAGAHMPGVSVRYEDCLRDPEVFVQLGAFFNFGRPEIMNALRLVNTRSAWLAQSGERNDKIFYNKMQAHYFSQYFSPEAVKRFAARHGATLAELGYGDLCPA